MISKFLYDILLGPPVTLGKEIVEKIVEEAKKECLMTEDSIKERLQQLQLQLQDGELSDEKYEELEAELIERLRTLREYERSQG